MRADCRFLSNQRIRQLHTGILCCFRRSPPLPPSSRYLVLTELQDHVGTLEHLALMIQLTTVTQRSDEAWKTMCCPLRVPFVSLISMPPLSIPTVWARIQSLPQHEPMLHLQGQRRGGPLL